MYVFDEINNTWIEKYHASYVIINITNQQIYYGYVSYNEDIMPIIFYDVYGNVNHGYIPVSLFNENDYIFSKRNGIYVNKINLTPRLQKYHNVKGHGEFPYSFPRRYEAIELFNKFYDQQVITPLKNKTKISKYLKYTVGIEYETSAGYIPENVCFSDGLIPLRDGSIQGLEYSTTVIHPNDIDKVLQQQLKTLKKYTIFDKECSLHMHFGGFPLETNKLLRLYMICCDIEPQLQTILPAYTFQTRLYKRTKKDYCQLLPLFDNFQELYRYYVGAPYGGDLTQPHPCDLDRQHKWNIRTRYHWLNIINSLCYNVNKTIEFRFLRPTYNFHKIVLWVYIFNAILQYAESEYTITNIDLCTILKTIYPANIYAELNRGLQALLSLKAKQEELKDFIGLKADLDNVYFTSNLKY
jgi:hypothetical protein